MSEIKKQTVDVVVDIDEDVDVVVDESIDSTGDNDPCIICLDENSKNMIKFPTNHSTCM